VGKDNIVFHCIIFPVMLMLHGNIVPDNVPANEFMNLESAKMSTSRNWKLDMQDYIDDFILAKNGGPQMADVLRYYLTTILPETKDSEFTWKGFQDANNSELVSIFGNFVNRTLVMMHKLCAGKVPPIHASVLDETDKSMIAEFELIKAKAGDNLEHYKFREALFEVIDLARKGNKYMQEKEPWIIARDMEELKKAGGANTHLQWDATDTNKKNVIEELQQQIDNCLHICLQLTANLAILINPFLPLTAKKILHLLKVVDKILDWENAGKLNLLSVGYSLRAPELLFRKIEDEEIKFQVEKLKAGLVNSAASNVVGKENAAPAMLHKSEIQFEDFAKLELRTGTIIAAEKVNKADKLLKLEVDLGFEKRTILSGIALHFKPEEIIHKQVVVVVNLAPRKMKGIDSNGMILMAEDSSGKLHFVNPDQKIEEGSAVT